MLARLLTVSPLLWCGKGGERHCMSDANYLREDGTGTEKERCAVVTLAGQTKRTGSNVERRDNGAQDGTEARCQEKDATKQRRCGQRSKGAHRGAEAQEHPTHTVPSTGDDGAQATRTRRHPDNAAQGILGAARPPTTPVSPPTFASAHTCYHAKPPLKNYFRKSNPEKALSIPCPFIL